MSINESNSTVMYDIEDLNKKEYLFDFKISQDQDVYAKIFLYNLTTKISSDLTQPYNFYVEYDADKEYGKIVLNDNVKQIPSFQIGARLEIYRNTQLVQLLQQDYEIKIVSKDVEASIDKMTMSLQDEKNRTKPMLWMNGEGGVLPANDYQKGAALVWDAKEKHITSSYADMSGRTPGISDHWKRLLLSITSLSDLKQQFDSTEMHKNTKILAPWTFLSDGLNFLKFKVKTIATNILGMFNSVNVGILNADQMSSQLDADKFIVDYGTYNICSDSTISCNTRKVDVATQETYIASEADFDKIKCDKLIYNYAREPISWCPGTIRGKYGTLEEPSILYKTSNGTTSGINFYEGRMYSDPWCSFISGGKEMLSVSAAGVISIPYKTYIHVTIDPPEDEEYYFTGTGPITLDNWKIIHDTRNEFVTEDGKQYFIPQEYGTYLYYATILFWPVYKNPLYYRSNWHILRLMIDGEPYQSTNYSMYGEWIAIVGAYFTTIQLNTCLRLKKGSKVSLQLERGVDAPDLLFMKKGKKYPEYADWERGSWPDTNMTEYCWIDIAKVA